ncbi:MAG: ferrous iron transporter B [Clostridia bacterium]|nr:ferrous iron transporter B [Clostridia bacterium]
MGLTGSLKNGRKSRAGHAKYRVLLVGCPNVGKSTLFNALTGLSRHTGNWTGKTVDSSAGPVRGTGGRIALIDTPGAYSLDATSPEERIVADAVRSGEADLILIVCDAGCLSRDLALVLQVLELSRRAIVCVNLVDEAQKNGLTVDCKTLSEKLGVPVLPAIASKGQGIRALIRSAEEALSEPRARPAQVDPALFEGLSSPEVRYSRASSIADAAVRKTGAGTEERRLAADRFLTGRFTGKLALLALLAAVFYLTMRGANYPSELLSRLFSGMLGVIRAWFEALGIPQTVTGAVCDGALATLFTVVAVMLPPMAIFFPLFTFLEDVGLLPRIAFNMDSAFAKCGSCGKQALPMCMGFGCNAAGVVGCRIIESPRERLIAQLTNSLVPCNGRFPILTALIPMLFASAAGAWTGLVRAAALTGLILISVSVSLLASRMLSRTLLRGRSSSFALELPPFRRPRIIKLVVRSIFDRTLRVLARAAAVAAPAGLAIHLIANASDGSLLRGAVGLLSGPGRFLGVDGEVLTAFVLSLPANELFLPMLIMLYSGGSTVPESAAGLAGALASHGWTYSTAACTLMLTLFHSPCATTLLTVKKETGSAFYTLAAFLVPTLTGAVLCLAVRLVFALF